MGPGPGAYQSVEKAAGVMLQSQPAYSFGSGRNVRSCKQPMSAASQHLLEAAKTGVAVLHQLWSVSSHF